MIPGKQYSFDTLMQVVNDPMQFAAYQAAMQWAKEPSETNRINALQIADATKFEGLGSVLAAAAGWSGGSLGPSDQPAIPPDDRLTARCICAALTIADSLGEPSNSSERLLGFIARVREPRPNHAQS